MKLNRKEMFQFYADLFQTDLNILDVKESNKLALISCFIHALK